VSLCLSEQILGPTQTSLLSSISIYSAISAKHAGVLNIQPNRQTYRPRYCVCSNRPPSVLCCGLKITKVAVVVVKLKACVIGLYLRRIWRVFRCETNGKLACQYHSKTPSTWSRDARTRLSCTRTRFSGLRTRLSEGGPRLS